jgi:hypothetical protein
MRGGDAENAYRGVEHVRVNVSAQFDLAVDQPRDLSSHSLRQITKVDVAACPRGGFLLDRSSAGRHEFDCAAIDLGDVLLIDVINPAFVRE